MATMGRQFVVPIIASFLVLVISGVNAWSAMLDKQSDVSAGWTLDGAFEYYKSGEQIPRLKAFLPQGFDYKNIRSAEGLWAVLSDPGEEESVAKFGYRLSSDKVIDSVTVTYSLGGNATLYLLDANNDTEPIYKIQPSSDHKYQLLTVTIPLETISSFYLKAVVHEKPAYVFIDRILAHFVDIPTPATTERPTTKSISPPAPTANPIVSHASIATSSLFATILIVAVKQLIT